MKQDLSILYADPDGAEQQSSTTQNGGGSFWDSLFGNLGGILTGAGNLAAGVNNKTTTTNLRETKTFNLNNGTTIAAIIGAAVVLTVLLVVIFLKH